jgi:hypothetical protein
VLPASGRLPDLLDPHQPEPLRRLFHRLDQGGDDLPQPDEPQAAGGGAGGREALGQRVEGEEQVPPDPPPKKLENPVVS